MVDIVRTLLGLEEQKAELKPKKVKRKAKKKADPAPERKPDGYYRRPVARTAPESKPKPEPEAEEVEPDDLDAE